MKKIRNLIVILLVCSLLLGSLPVSAVTKPVPYRTGYYQVLPANGLNIRKSYSTNSTILGTIRCLEYVYCINSTVQKNGNHYWIKVRAHGFEGWIAAEKNINNRTIETNVRDCGRPGVTQLYINQPANNAVLPYNKACAINVSVDNFRSETVIVEGYILNPKTNTIVQTSGYKRPNIKMGPDSCKNLNGTNIDNYLKFGNLARGEYQLYIRVLRTNGSELTKRKVTFKIA